MLKQMIISLFMILALFSFSACAQTQPCPVCPTITIPYVEDENFETVELHYERIY